MSDKGHLKLVPERTVLDSVDLRCMASSIDMYTRAMQDALVTLQEAGASTRTIQLGNAAVADSRHFAELLREEADR